MSYICICILYIYIVFSGGDPVVAGVPEAGRGCVYARA